MTSIDIITVGDELIEGRLIDTNAGHLSGRLAENGLEVRSHCSVGDDKAVLGATLRSSAERSAAVLVAGGLGPTTDDLTAEAAASTFFQKLELNDVALKHVETAFELMGRKMPPNNEKQAWIPESATLIRNYRGTACGFHMDVGNCRLYFMPGVPHELEAMFERSVLPDLLARLKPAPQWISGFRICGMGESKVGSLLEDLKAAPPGHLTIQYRAAAPEIHVRLCLRGYEDSSAAETELGRLSEEVMQRLGRAVFTRGDESLPEMVLNLLEERGATLAAAESCTGGILSSLFIDVPGASKVFLGGTVAYANEVKTSGLGIPESLVAEHGAVSSEVAEAMARAVRQQTGASHALATTGIAGPTGGTSDKPVGTVFLALDSEAGTMSKRVHYVGDRQRIRRYSAYGAIEILRRALLDLL